MFLQYSISSVWYQENYININVYKTKDVQSDTNTRIINRVRLIPIRQNMYIVLTKELIKI